ncbi:MAG: bifunctional folylpolyglutamate synthase/dihydrofolate synthase [Verrucomicrobiaceae bacterium]|nr:bifunctional folylpolyglutamate synthase/dihydrofolate synthase [Verrucomicrobiaceae bacterium]
MRLQHEKDALDWLYGTQLYGMKLGLENMWKLLAALNVPPGGQRIIHVAGTNGKGSTCSFMHAMLKEAGVNAGLFTSPHLIEFRERIRDAERLISPAELCAGITMIRELTLDWDPHPTFFEIALGIAMDWYRKRGLSWVILETGMGGRLDATNALTPAVSVITPIGFDHMQSLGHTLAAIAGEKAGIIKPGVPVVSAPQEPEAMEVIRRVAAGLGSALTVVDAPLPCPLGLVGGHQGWNAAVAVAALRAAGFDFTDAVIREGLRKTEWPARFQRLDERTILDGAHNGHAARVLVAAWRQQFGGEKATIILGSSTGKDTSAVLQELRPIAKRWILTGFRSHRAVPTASVHGKLVQIDPGAEVHEATAIAGALAIAERFPERRLITGSLYFAGEVLAHRHALACEVSDQ